MTSLNITNVVVHNNPSPFLTQLKFQITFECIRELPEVVEWKLIYIGSARDPSYDQIIDSFEMGPLAPGTMYFMVESNPPDYKKIPKEDLLDVTAIVISVSYRKQEFFRVGYYIHNEYVEQELIDNPPEQLLIDRLCRKILADKPRITRSNIAWVDAIPAIENIPMNGIQMDDPFMKSNGAFEQLEQLKPNTALNQSYSYGMFEQQNWTQH